MSALEMAKGYTKSVENGRNPMILPSEIRNAHEDLTAKRKLNQKVTTDEKLKPGHLAQVSSNKVTRRRASGPERKLFFPTMKIQDLLQYLVSAERKFTAAVEDTRLGLKEDSFANAVQESIGRKFLYRDGEESTCL